MEFITLLVTVCINLSQPGTCVTEKIADNQQFPDMTMSTCMNGPDAQASVAKWWQEHPLYHNWHVKGYGCQFGNKKAPEKGKA